MGVPLVDLWATTWGFAMMIRLAAVMGEPQVKQQFESQGFEIVANTPAQFAAFQSQESARWKKVIETGKITAD